jgi:hypothetical protein
MAWWLKMSADKGGKNSKPSITENFKKLLENSIFMRIWNICTGKLYVPKLLAQSFNSAVKKLEEAKIKEQEYLDREHSSFRHISDYKTAAGLDV